MKKIFSRLMILILFVGILLTSVVFVLKYLNSQVDTSKKPLVLTKKVKPKKRKSRSGSYMKLKNVHFRLSDKIDLHIKNLLAEAIPLKPFKLVDFDNVNSFAIDIFQGEVTIPVRVLKYVFNDVVFNYKGSPLRNLDMSFIKVKGEKNRRVKMNGEMKLGPIWLSFESTGVVKLDTKRVLMILEIEKVTTMGNPASKQLMDLVGLTIDKLLGVAKGRGVTVYKNQVIIEPFTLFPPPMMGGYLSEMKLLDKHLYLKFVNSFKPKMPPLPVKAKNYLFIDKGTVKFGRLTMHNARLLMIDKDPKDSFDFYLKYYFQPLTRAVAKIRKDGSVVATLPDFYDK